jgi:hypothetical protein
MIQFLKPDRSVLTDLAYVSSNLSNQADKIVALIRCIDIGGALLDFLEKYAK